MPPPVSPVTSRAVPLFLIAVILSWGSYLRLADLGEANFNADELDHYYAAIGLSQGRGPVLPSGSMYTRGLDITRLVSRSIGVSDDREFAARVPSATFGIIGLVLMALVAWALAGPWPAVWATFLLAIFPEAIIQARMTRFYTYQMCFGLPAMLTGWLAIRSAGRSETPAASETLRAWGWALLTVVLLGLAVRIQLTSLSVLVAWCLAVAIAALSDLRARGREAWRGSFAIQAAVLGLTGMLLVVAFLPDKLEVYAAVSQRVPAWSAPGSVLSYYYSLSRYFPLLVALIPLILVAAFARKRRLAVYLAVWFFVPLLLHSLVFPWKGDRYILLAMPALFVATGMAAATGVRALRQWLTAVFETLGRESGRRIPASGLAAIGVALIVGFAIATQHGFNEARRIPPNRKPIDWEAAQRLIERTHGVEGTPLGTSIGLPALFYWGRADFVVGTDFLEAPDDNGSLVLRPEGSPDWYSGSPVVTTPDGIRERFGAVGAVLVGIDTDRWRFNNIDAELKRVLGREGVELCLGRCGDLLLFEWRFASDGVEPDSTGKPAGGL